MEIEERNIKRPHPHWIARQCKKYTTQKHSEVQSLFYLVFKLFHKNINPSYNCCNIFMCQNNAFRISTGSTCVHYRTYVQRLRWKDLGWIFFSLMNKRLWKSTTKEKYVKRTELVCYKVRTKIYSRRWQLPLALVGFHPSQRAMCIVFYPIWSWIYEGLNMYITINLLRKWVPHDGKTKHWETNHMEELIPWIWFDSNVGCLVLLFLCRWSKANHHCNNEESH